MAYLLLENGLKIEGDLFGKNENIFGGLALSGETLVLKSLSGQNDCVLTEGSASVKNGESAFFTKETSALKAHLHCNEMLLGKIVLDTLDLDYHLHDLKTYVPGTIKMKSENKKKAAA